jgi:hypothetical protein
MTMSGYARARCSLCRSASQGTCLVQAPARRCNSGVTHGGHPCVGDGVGTGRDGRPERRAVLLRQGAVEQEVHQDLVGQVGPVWQRQLGASVCSLGFAARVRLVSAYCHCRRAVSTAPARTNIKRWSPMCRPSRRLLLATQTYSGSPKRPRPRPPRRRLRRQGLAAAGVPRFLHDAGVPLVL